MGEIYSELYPYTQLDESDPDYVDPTEARLISTSFGAVSGSLDFLGAVSILGKLTGAPKEVAKKYYQRLLQGLPEGVIIEGGTEAAQEFINFAADKYAKGEEAELTDQDVDRLWDAGILGAIGGTGFTAVGAIKGPKEKVQDNKTPDLSGEIEVEKRTELLDSLKKNRAEEELMFSVGDDVQIAMGDTGVVKEILGDEATIELPDGTLKSNVPVRSLSITIPEEKNIKVEEDPKEDLTPEDILKPESNTKTQVTKSGKIVPVTPKAEPKVDVIVGGVKVTSGTTEDGKDATLQAPQSTVEAANKIHDRLKVLAESGQMSKNTALANKTRGWASNSRSELKLHLGEDYKLLNDDVRALLKSAGHINGSNEWLHETKVDKEFREKKEQELKDLRIQYVSNPKLDWITEGREVEIKRSGGIRGTIEKVDFETGLVTVDGKQYDARTQLKPIALPKVRKKNPAPTFGGLGYPSQPTSKVADEAKTQLEELEDIWEPDFFDEQQDVPLTTPDGLEVQEISLLYTTGAKKERKSKVIKASTREQFADEVRKLIDKMRRNKGNEGPAFLNTFYGVEINGKEGQVTHDGSSARDASSFSLAGFEVPMVDPMFFERRKGDIEVPMLDVEFDPSLHELDEVTGKARGIELREGIEGGNVLLVIRQDGEGDPLNPVGSVRVVSAKEAKYAKRQTPKNLR